MSTSKDTQGHAAGPPLETLFDGAKPRPRAADVDRQMVYDAVYAEWDRVSGRRRTGRFALAGAMAAGLVAALALMFIRATPDADTVNVAFVDRFEGTVMVTAADEDIWRPLTGTAYTFTSGSRVKVLDGALGLTPAAGGSLRVGADTTLTLAAADRVELSMGKLYFDSRNDNQHADIQVDTRWGTVRDIGTQFAVEVSSAALAVSVRSGAAALASGAHPEQTARAGERLSLRGDSGAFVIDTIDTRGDHWAWADALAPGFALNDRPAIEFLEWLARETGHRLVFADEEARRLASEAELKGPPVTSASLDKLSVLWATSVEATVVDGAIVVVSSGK